MNINKLMRKFAVLLTACVLLIGQNKVSGADINQQKPEPPDLPLKPEQPIVPVTPVAPPPPQEPIVPNQQPHETNNVTGLHD